MSENTLPDAYTREVVGDDEVVALPETRAWAAGVVVEHGSLFAWAAAQPGSSELQGRGVTYVVDAPAQLGRDDGERWVVRQYRRGGMIARFVRDRYLDIGDRRPLRELRASVRARERGVPTPEVVAAGIYPVGVWYRADIVTRWIPNSVDLGDALFDAAGIQNDAEARRREAMAAAGALVRRAHLAGVVHNDLNLKNVLITGLGEGRPEAWLLDLDRAVVVRDEVARFERDQMLRRFARSLKKFERQRRARLGDAARVAFAEAYARAASTAAAEGES